LESCSGGVTVDPSCSGTGNTQACILDSIGEPHISGAGLFNETAIIGIGSHLGIDSFEGIVVSKGVDSDGDYSSSRKVADDEAGEIEG
jgi:hypothetical protein